jgi:hypothetical protein
MGAAVCVYGRVMVTCTLAPGDLRRTDYLTRMAIRAVRTPGIAVAPYVPHNL